jgi:uncharacterized BrkB/YihY/UPF0761 family membrane protein
MKAILKPIFEFLIGGFTLFDNVIYNYIALGIIGALAFAFAFRFVGFLYDVGAIESREAGSLLHWTIRLIAFLVLFITTYAVIWLVRFFISNPIWFWIIVGVIVAGIVVLVIVLVKKRADENK